MIIGSGHPAHDRSSWLSGSTIDLTSKSANIAAKLGKSGHPGSHVPVHRQAIGPLIVPADAALMACLAGRAAASEERVARMVPQIRALLALHPGGSLARIARLVLEAELRGIPATIAGFDGLLRLDDFGQVVSGSAGSNQDSDPDRGRDHARQSPFSDQAKPVDPQSSPPTILADGGLTGNDPEINAILDGLAKPQAGRMAWHWLALGGNAWSSGGSLRIADSPAGRLVNLDVNVAEGYWQFHWSEPQRNRLYFARPEGGAGQFRLKKCLAVMQAAIGPLGFGDFVEMNPKDWYDGFTYLPSASIIRHVDIVT